MTTILIDRHGRPTVRVNGQATDFASAVNRKDSDHAQPQRPQG